MQSHGCVDRAHTGQASEGVPRRRRRRGRERGVGWGRCLRPSPARGGWGDHMTPLGTAVHPALRLRVCLWYTPQLHHPLQEAPPSSEFQVPGQSEAAPDPRKGDGQVPAPHAAPKHTHRHVHTRPRTHTRAPAHTHAPLRTHTRPRTHARTHTHTHARTHVSLSSVPAREVWLKLSCPPWCLQSSCQHPPADSPSPACEANAGPMNSPAQRGGRQSLQGAEVEAQACGRCGRHGCCSRCGRRASVAGMAGQARGP